MLSKAVHVSIFTISWNSVGLSPLQYFLSRALKSSKNHVRKCQVLQGTNKISEDSNWEPHKFISNSFCEKSFNDFLGLLAVSTVGITLKALAGFLQVAFLVQLPTSPIPVTRVSNGMVGVQICINLGQWCSPHSTPNVHCWLRPWLQYLW